MAPHLEGRAKREEANLMDSCGGQFQPSPGVNDRHVQAADMTEGQGLAEAYLSFARRGLAYVFHLNL
jgi:hypothetical protein